MLGAAGLQVAKTFLPHVGHYGGHNVLLAQNGIDFGGALRLDCDNDIAQHFIPGHTTHLQVKLGVDCFFASHSPVMPDGNKRDYLWFLSLGPKLR